MANSTPNPGGRKAKKKPPAKPKKPREDFPLYAHSSGYWAKKVRGVTHYFGKWADDPKGVAALDQWLEQKDDLIAGRRPRSKGEVVTLNYLVSVFLDRKEDQRDNGELSPHTYRTYYLTCEKLIKYFGKNRAVDDLQPDDFHKLRKHLGKTLGLVALGNEIQRVRTIFKFGYEKGDLDRPVRYGQDFAKPKAKHVKKAKNTKRREHGANKFEAEQVLLMLTACQGGELTLLEVDPDTGEPYQLTTRANVGLCAMILLALNCGFGQTDIGNLPMSALDLDGGWLDYPRPKTEMERRIPLWPETVDAVRAWLPVRPKPKTKEDKNLLFITPQGRRYMRVDDKGESHDGIGQLFDRLLTRLKLKRPGVRFYTFRHTFETVAGASKDQVAVDAIMGHSDGSMAAHYREDIGDDRLLAVAEHVRAWLFGPVGTVGGPRGTKTNYFKYLKQLYRKKLPKPATKNSTKNKTKYPQPAAKPTKPEAEHPPGDEPPALRLFVG